MNTSLTKWKTHALKVYYETERYGKTHTKILCPKHREAFYSMHPNARGCGEYYPIEDCEICKEEKL